MYYKIVLINGLTHSEDVVKFSNNRKKGQKTGKEITTLFTITRNPKIKHGPARETKRFKKLLTESLRNRGKEDWLVKYDKLESILKEVIGATSITQHDIKVLDCIIVNVGKFIRGGI